MPFIRIQGLDGNVFVPECCSLDSKKHPCRDCFNCQHCSDDRCRLCRCKPCDEPGDEASEKSLFSGKTIP